MTPPPWPRSSAPASAAPSGPALHGGDLSTESGRVLIPRPDAFLPDLTSSEPTEHSAPCTRLLKVDAKAGPSSSASTVIECIAVEKALGRHRVLNGVSCRVPRGQITAIMGPSGAGKSVLLRLFAGLLVPDRGNVLLNGHGVPMLGEEELRSVRRNVGMLFQDGPLFRSMTLHDNVAFPLRWHTDKSEREIREIATAWLVEVGLAGCEGRSPHDLSVEMRKRAGLARALVLEPRILLFDDPDAGLDAEPAARLWQLIRDIQRRRESTAVVVGRDTRAVFEIADRVILLRGGRVVDQGSKERLRACR